VENVAFENMGSDEVITSLFTKPVAKNNKTNKYSNLKKRKLLKNIMAPLLHRTAITIRELN